MHNISIVIHDTQCLVSMIDNCMCGIRHTQYLCPVYTMHNFFGLVAKMNNICDWYPWYTIFMSGIHDTYYLCLVLKHRLHYKWTDTDG